MKLVLDTNVVLDWLVFEDPVLTSFREALQLRRVGLLADSQSADELRRVLEYPALGLDPLRRERIFQEYLDQTVRIDSAGPATGADPALPDRFVRCRDPDDNHFLALAWRGRADGLVTRDNALLAVKKRALAFGIRILDLAELTAALR